MDTKAPTQAPAKHRDGHRAWQAVLLMERQPMPDGMEVAQYVPTGPLYATAMEAMEHAAHAMNERADVIGVTARAVPVAAKAEG